MPGLGVGSRGNTMHITDETKNIAVTALLIAMGVISPDQLSFDEAFPAFKELTKDTVGDEVVALVLAEATR